MWGDNGTSIEIDRYMQQTWKKYIMKTCFSYFPSKNFPLDIILKTFLSEPAIFFFFFAFSQLEMKLSDHQKCPEFRKNCISIKLYRKRQSAKKKGKTIFSIPNWFQSIQNWILHLLVKSFFFKNKSAWSAVKLEKPR